MHATGTGVIAILDGVGTLSITAFSPLFVAIDPLTTGLPLPHYGMNATFWGVNATRSGVGLLPVTNDGSSSVIGVDLHAAYVTVSGGIPITQLSAACGSFSASAIAVGQ